MVVRTTVLKSESFSHYEYARSCITAEDGMSKQQIIANGTSQHSLHTYLMFQHRGLFFMPDLISGLKKTWQESTLKWKHRSTSNSMSSPTRIVSQYIADCTIVSTIRTSASRLAWHVSHPTCSKLWPSILMNRCLLSLLDKRFSFFF